MINVSQSRTGDLAHPGIRSTLAGNGRSSVQLRTSHPDEPEAIHPRARELADSIREFTGSAGGASEADLRGAGFTMAEITEHLPLAETLICESFVRHAPPPGDRVPEIIDKALVSASHRIPATAAHVTTDRNVAEWRAFCTARAAFRLDPWVSQGERCITLLARFLAGLPLLEREANRVIFAIAAEQKHALQRHTGNSPKGNNQ